MFSKLGTALRVSFLRIVKEKEVYLWGKIMFTIETKQMDIIINNVYSEKAKDSLYHMLINYEIYKSTAEMIDENMEKLNFYNFAKTQTCHMNDGIFGGEKYRDYQFVYQLKVIGNLIVLITAAHRIITCIKQARANEKSSDWKVLSDEIENCDKTFDNKLRNFMEHLEEKIYKQELTNQNCRFSPQRILYCRDEKVNKQFDFNNYKLQAIDKLIENLLKMLSDRGGRDVRY